MSSTNPTTPTPLISRRSVYVAAVVFAVAVLPVSALGPARNLSAPGRVVDALLLGVMAACFLVADGVALIIAWRLRSPLLMLLVIALPLPPLGPALCALFSGLWRRRP